MTEGKWIIDGHHYTCPNCKKTIAVVINESDEGFEFCPFCGKKMSVQIPENKVQLSENKSQMPENKMELVSKIFFNKELNEIFEVFMEDCGYAYVKFTYDGLRMVHPDGKIFSRNDIEEYGFNVNLEDLLTGIAVAVE